jgi:hypothetical protein
MNLYIYKKAEDKTGKEKRQREYVGGSLLFHLGFVSDRRISDNIFKL